MRFGMTMACVPAKDCRSFSDILGTATRWKVSQLVEQRSSNQTRSASQRTESAILSIQMKVESEGTCENFIGAAVGSNFMPP